MRSLFIYIVHSNQMGLKISTKGTIDNPGVITLGVYYNIDGSLYINGSPIITESLQNKATWFRDTQADLADRLALLKQLFDKLVTQYGLSSDQIYLYTEGNLGDPGGNQLSAINLELINYMNPGAAILPSGTPECCKFIHYWRDVLGYPALNIEDDFFQAANYDRSSDYYSVAELTPSKIAELNRLVETMCLNCAPPRITTFDKKLTVISAKYLLQRMIEPQIGSSQINTRIANHDVETLLVPERVSLFRTPSKRAYRGEWDASFKQLTSHHSQVEIQIEEANTSVSRQPIKTARFWCCCGSSLDAVAPIKPPAQIDNQDLDGLYRSGGAR